MEISSEVEVVDTVVTVTLDTVYVDTGISREHIRLVEVADVKSTSLVDTAAIIDSYLQKHEYLTNYRDSSINLELRPVVQLGVLDSIGVRYQLIRPLQTQIVHQRRIPRWQVYGGLSSTWTPQHTEVAPMLQVKYRNDYSFGLGYAPWPNGGSVTLNAAFKLFDLP
ncbi:hypothetical protein GCM10011318_00960 [Phaeocystidibacter marisrubri]|nr:hypothetical protein GCM10011318_00960 [Phaeocystidibacter marisrubri]